jgi:hypothetical protein
LSFSETLSCGLLSTLYFLVGGQHAFRLREAGGLPKAVDFADADGTLTKGFPPRRLLSGRLTQPHPSWPTNSTARTIHRSEHRRGERPIHEARLEEFLWHRRDSVQECVPHLELAVRQELLDSMRHKVRREDLEEITRMLSGLINSLDKRD